VSRHGAPPDTPHDEIIERGAPLSTADLCAFFGTLGVIVFALFETHDPVCLYPLSAVALRALGARSSLIVDVVRAVRR
jgi:hypothetical protein